MSKITGAQVLLVIISGIALAGYVQQPLQEFHLGPWETIRERLTFSEIGCHVAYITPRGDKQLVVMDGRSGPEYDEIAWLRFSPDGERVAYEAKKGSKWLVVCPIREPHLFSSRRIWHSATS